MAWPKSNGSDAAPKGQWNMQPYIDGGTSQWEDLQHP